MTNRVQSQIVAVRLPSDMAQALQEAAKSDARSVSNYVMILIREHLAALPGDSSARKRQASR